MSQDLSQALVASVPQIQYVADPYGRLVVPVTISGCIHHLNIQPDMDYVISHVIQAKGSQFLLEAIQ